MSSPTVNEMAVLPDAAYLVALASLPYTDHATLRRLLDGRRAKETWDAVVGGRAGPSALRVAAARIDPASLWQQHAAVSVLSAGHPGFPADLSDDVEPPPVLFGRGAHPEAVDQGRRRVGIIGTRRCTPYGREVAGELGAALAGVGVVVVSGLAAGIDGAAHEGALAAPPGSAPVAAVVGSGLDVAYPRGSGRLWDRVAAAGIILSEAPLGGRPEAWRFPARNRLIAALSDVLVVVESHVAGGSMHTVRAAIDRGVPVMAVPGSIRSPASAGTNLLLTEGVAPVTGAEDVLVALDLEGAGGAGGPAPVEQPLPIGDPGRVLEALGWEPADLDTLLRRTDLTPPKAAVALAVLESAGLISCDAGWWRRL